MNKESVAQSPHLRFWSQHLPMRSLPKLQASGEGLKLVAQRGAPGYSIAFLANIWGIDNHWDNNSKQIILIVQFFWKFGNIIQIV